MKGRIKRSTTVIAAVALAALLAVPGAALAKGPGGGGGGGGGGGETTLTNNLSVPAIIVSADGTVQPFTGLTCDGVYYLEPSGDPTTGYEIDPAAYYFVQGLNKWQAPCALASAADAVTATPDWGDNLSGDAKLKVGSPIRVEVGLNAGASLKGLTVEKLQPSLLDRLSKYGTLATMDLATGKYVATWTEPFPETRVFDNAATLKIYNTVSGTVIYDGEATAEINATGRIVYGYNLRVPTAGTYTIEFRTVNVAMLTGTSNGYLFTLDIVVGSGGGGGGGRK